MKILKILALLFGLATSASANSYYDLSQSTTTGKATMNLHGALNISASSATLTLPVSTPTIILNGAIPSIVVQSGSTASTMTASGFAGTITATGGTITNVTISTNSLLNTSLPQGNVVMFPTTVNTVSGADAWTVLASSGTPVNTSGTTTRGLQEAINYAANNGMPLKVYGWGSASAFTQPYIAATSAISFPAVQQWSAEFHDVNITFSTAVSTDAITFDSGIIEDVSFYGGQIVYGGKGCAIRFNPKTVLPIDGFSAISDSHFFISNIAINNGNPFGVICFTPFSGGINNNYFSFLETNGGQLATYNVVVSTPGAGDAFQENFITATHIHESTSTNIQDGFTTNQTQIRGNNWNISGIDPWGANSVGVYIFGSSETFNIGHINGETSVSTAVVFGAGANYNLLTLGGVLSTTGPTILDSGSQNMKIVGGNVIGNLFVSSAIGIQTGLVTAGYGLENDGWSLFKSTVALANQTTATAAGDIAYDQTNNELDIGVGTSTAAVHMAAWYTYTPAWAGCTGQPTATGTYSKYGKTVTVHVVTSAGCTSNATTFTATLPVPALRASEVYLTGPLTDNSSNLTSPGAVVTGANSTTVSIFKTMAFGAWTNTGTKAADFYFTYEANIY